MESCIYEGRVRHARTRPALHRFSYRLFMMYLDLDELPGLFEKRWFWSVNRPAIARFRREDHLGPADQPLAESVRDLVAAQTGKRPAGPIRLLTNLSYFGYGFNPVSFYYCFAADGSAVETIVAEVNNTPWGEQDTYVMPCTNKTDKTASWRFSPQKKLHVSPFMPMEIEYDWVLTAPDQRLSVHMANSQDGKRIFDAAMNMRRKEITIGSLAGVLVRFPFLTVKIIAAIHWQALLLWLKRCPVYVHPKKKRLLAVRSQ
jgi:DUF1365 family protein